VGLCFSTQPLLKALLDHIPNPWYQHIASKLPHCWYM
jgi:hypothetical protein